jgi:hypothetical protein
MCPRRWLGSQSRYWWLPLEACAAIEAARRGRDRDVLVAQLLRLVARDDLFAAIIDRSDARPGECQARSGLPRLFGGPREDRLARLSLGLPEFLAARGGDGVRPPAEKAGFLVRLEELQNEAADGAVMSAK